MNPLLELANLPLDDLSGERVASLRENASHWLAIDYEAISAALDIEINTEMSPLVIQRVVEKRLGEMTVGDMEEIPAFVWECLDALDVAGTGNYLRFHPSNQGRRSNAPFQIKKLSVDTILLKPRGTTLAVLLRELGTQPRWALWCRTHAPVIEFQKGFEGPRLTSAQFAPWGERELEQIFCSFYAE